MKGFVVTSHYEVEENQAKIHIFGRLENDKSFEAIVTSKPYFFIRKKDEASAKKIIEGKIEPTKLQTLGREEVSKITINNPKEIPQLRKILEDNNIPCFEADIRFTQRYFIDKGIFSSIEIEGENKKGEYTDYIFEEPKITPCDNVATPKMLSIDIETDKDAKKIYSISLHTDNYKEVIVVSNETFVKSPEIEYATIVNSEKSLLQSFLGKLKELDPDIITGWHVIDFDLDVIAKKCKQHNIQFNIGRTSKTTNIRIEQSFFRDSGVHAQGRIVLDGIQLLKSSFVKLDNYKLNTAAKHFLGETKTIEDDDRCQLIEKKYLEQAKEFVEYNLKDSVLVTKILHKSGIFELTIQRSLLTGLHMDNVKASIASFDSLYLRDLRKAGFVANTTRPINRDEGLGGFVMTSKPGLYANVIVLDFKSLYPSIMRTFNIDPVGYLGEEETLKDKDPKKYIIAPNGAVFANNQGILSNILERLWIARDNARKEGNELARYAIKILMNSLYGVLASPNSRFHNRKISNAITYFAQYFIKLTAKKLKEENYEVIYGDTDSVFVNLKKDNKKESEKIGKEIETNLNNFLKEYIKTKYERESILELEFEKLFLKFFMPKARGLDVGAKKRYAGLREKKDGSIYIDFTGLEFVRKDWTEVAKEFQMKLLKLIFEDKEVDKFIKDFVKKIYEGKYDDLLIYRKSLRKDVNSYTKTTPPHVKAARLLNEIKSKTIEYYITKEGPQPLQKLTSPLDYEHYIEKQIKPIANSILELQNKTFEEVISGTSQKGLGDFFK